MWGGDLGLCDGLVSIGRGGVGESGGLCLVVWKEGDLGVRM